MAAPQISYSKDYDKVSAARHVTVRFSADAAYESFECRATKTGEPYGVGIGELIASFSYTPAGTERTFEIYNTDLLEGDGLYRLSLFAKGEDGSWNDDIAFYTSENEPVLTGDGKNYLVQKGA